MILKAEDDQFHTRGEKKLCTDLLGPEAYLMVSTLSDLEMPIRGVVQNAGIVGLMVGCDYSTCCFEVWGW